MREANEKRDMLALFLLVAIASFLVKSIFFSSFNVYSLAHIGLLVLGFVLFKVSAYWGVATYVVCLVWLFAD